MNIPNVFDGFTTLLEEKDLQEVNGGGVAGAAVGYVAGVLVGTFACIGVGIASAAAGDSRSMTTKAIFTTFIGSIITGTVIGGCVTGVF